MSETAGGLWRPCMALKVLIALSLVVGQLLVYAATDKRLRQDLRANKPTTQCLRGLPGGLPLLGGFWGASASWGVPEVPLPKAPSPVQMAQTSCK